MNEEPTPLHGVPPVETYEQLQRRADRCAVELARVEEICQKYQREQCYYQHANNTAQKAETVICQYRDVAAEALSAAKAFRDRMLTHFHALELVMEMVSSASTHREKDARLRGCIELIQSAISKLERESFDLSLVNRPNFDWSHLYRCDFPTRHYVEKIRELEQALAAYQGPPAQAEPVKDSDAIF